MMQPISLLHFAVFTAVCDDPTGDAQAMATDLQSLYAMLEQLQKDPSLAKNPTWVAKLASEVNALQNKYNQIKALGTILPSDLSKMYEMVADNFINVPLAPGSSIHLLGACQKAQQGDLSDLETLLTAFSAQPDMLQLSIDALQNASQGFEAYAAHPPPPATDDPTKDAAQAMASKMQALYALLQALQKNPSLANDPIWQAALAQDVDAIQREYRSIVNMGPIPPTDMAAMYQSINDHVMNAPASPPSTQHFLNACEEALGGNTADFEGFIHTLSAQSGQLQIFINAIQTSEQEFQTYADTH